MQMFRSSYDLKWNNVYIKITLDGNVHLMNKTELEHLLLESQANKNVVCFSSGELLHVCVIIVPEWHTLLVVSLWVFSVVDSCKALSLLSISAGTCIS